MKLTFEGRLAGLYVGLHARNHLLVAQRQQGVGMVEVGGDDGPRRILIFVLKLVQVEVRPAG